MATGPEAKMQKELRAILNELQIIASIIEQEGQVIRRLKGPEANQPLDPNSASLGALENLSFKLADYSSELQNMVATAKNAQQDVSPENSPVDELN